MTSEDTYQETLLRVQASKKSQAGELSVLQIKALQALETMLRPPIATAEAGDVVTQSLDDIFDSEIRAYVFMSQPS